MVAQRAGDLRELRHIARLEQRVTGVRGERAEHVRPHHRHDHRAVAAGRLAGQRARFAVGQRRIALLDERDDLVAQVVLIAAEPERVQELRTAVGRPAVDERDQRVRAVAGGEHRVDPLDHRGLERGAVEPHVDLARVALDDVDDGQRSRVVELDPGRAVDVQRPACRIAQRIVRQELGLDDQTVERAVHRPLPRRARRTFNFAQCHSGERYRSQMPRILVAVVLAFAVLAVPASAAPKKGPGGAGFYKPPKHLKGAHGGLIWVHKQTGKDALKGAAQRAPPLSLEGPQRQGDRGLGLGRDPEGQGPEGRLADHHLRPWDDRRGRRLRADEGLRQGQAHQLRVPAAQALDQGRLRGRADRLRRARDSGRAPVPGRHVRGPQRARRGARRACLRRQAVQALHDRRALAGRSRRAVRRRGGAEVPARAQAARHGRVRARLAPRRRSSSSPRRSRRRAAASARSSGSACAPSTAPTPAWACRTF